MMHSLGVKLVSLKSATISTAWASHRESTKPCFVILSVSNSSSSERDGSENGKMLSSPIASFLSKSQNYALLKKQLAVAAKSEVDFLVTSFNDAKLVREFFSHLTESLISELFILNPLMLLSLMDFVDVHQNILLRDNDGIFDSLSNKWFLLKCLCTLLGSISSLFNPNEDFLNPVLRYQTNETRDYKEAARIRDSLKSFEEKEPVLRLKGLLKKAIQEERFEDAARYRNELKILAPHTLLKCSSDATTAGIRVQVRSVYIESRSQPSKGQYFFAYRIRITNNSKHPVQILRRHWIITDGNERTENIWGVGVIGEQPVILPNTGFEYSSACPLSTPNGRMEGDFEMKHIDMVGSSTFNVAIAPFSLSFVGDEDGGLL